MKAPESDKTVICRRGSGSCSRGLFLLKGSVLESFQNKITDHNIMKSIRITTFIAAALMTAGTALAQAGPDRQGGGYGGPPQTAAERAARQEECQKANGGTCDGQGQGNGSYGGRGNGQRKANGQGQSQGQRRGPRDGSGPRGGGGNCPA